MAGSSIWANPLWVALGIYCLGCWGAMMLCTIEKAAEWRTDPEMPKLASASGVGIAVLWIAVVVFAPIWVAIAYIHEKFR